MGAVLYAQLKMAISVQVDQQLTVPFASTHPR